MFRGFHFIPPDTKIDFVGMRAITWIVSAFLTLAPLVLVATIGLNMGIDFQGGTLIEIKTKESPANLADIRAKVSGLGLGEVQIQEFGAPDAVLIRIASQPTEQEQQASIAKVKAALGDTVEYRRVEIVGPTISGELIASGTIAVVVALMGILIYVWFRFEWQFAVAAIASLIHDVTGTIGLYSLFQLEFNVSSIAAILTIIGYSLNDKVVIFDRIRENLRKYKRMPLVQLLDVSINETLARAVLTHVTTFLAMLPFLFFGGETIFGFALAMCWGIVIGAYSSIFVASPLQLILGRAARGVERSAGDRQGETGGGPHLILAKRGETLHEAERGDTLRRIARSGDPDRSLAASFAPREARADLFALIAFNVELARIAEIVSEPGLGTIRLQWWRDAIDARGKGRGDGASCRRRDRRGVAAAKTVTRAHRRADRCPQLRHRDQDHARLGLARGLSRRDRRRIVRIRRRVSRVARSDRSKGRPVQAGLAYGLTGLMRALPVHAASGRVYLPADALLRHGTSPEAVLAGESSDGLLAVLAELRLEARQALAAANRHVAELDSQCARRLPAALPG